MNREQLHHQTLPLCLVALALLVIASVACLQSKSATKTTEAVTITLPPAPTTPPALDVPVKITRRPATFGFPLKEAANIRDAARLALKDASGKAIAAQFRVLSRWRGVAADAGRPIKWLLIDTDAAAGDYRLSSGVDQANPAVSMATTEGATLEVNAARLRMRVPKQGTTLLAGLELDGSERLKQPMTITMELPRAALLIDKVFAARSELKVSDATALPAGARVRFEHLGEIAFDIERDSPFFIARGADMMEGDRTYRLDEGTSREEEVFVVKKDDSGKLYTREPLRFAHPSGARVRDLTTESEKAVVRAASGQTVTLSSPLKNVHSLFERVIVADDTVMPLRLTAYADETRIEEGGPVRTVIRQNGHFQTEGAPNAAITPLRFTLRYHVYAAQSFVRLQFRMVNTGPFGFGGDRTKQPPFMQHILLSGLTVNLPFAVAPDSRTQREEVRSGPGKAMEKRVATVSVNAANKSIEVTAPEFAENFPKALTADSNGVRFDILPPLMRPANNPTGAPKSAPQTTTRSAKPAELPPLRLGPDYYIFDGARAKSTEFFIGTDTRTAAAMTSSFGAALAPAYVAESKAVRPAMVEKRDWKQVFADDRSLATSATRLERWLASSYAREANEEDNGKSVFEVRQEGSHYGWRNFGDLEWGDGFSNLHYDIPWIMLREYLRTGDKRAYQLGSEMARYRADWGQYQADDYLDKERTWNLHGTAFYEKGDHGTYREPIMTHHWIEGLWLYWALTGDEAVHQSAIEGTEAIVHINFTFDNSLSWGEARYAGWPVLGVMAAWRYSGEVRYLEKAKKISYLIVQAEEDFGRKGYYIPPGSTMGNKTQPFMWAGYAQLGLIEYWRETSDQRAADFLVRVADWLVGKIPGQQPPVLTGGATKPDGTYMPIGAPYFWAPGRENEEPALINSMINLPVLAVAAQISGRADLRAKAQQLFRDTTWFRDAKSGAGVNTTDSSPIAFRTRAYPGSYPKVYGQFSLFVPEYLAVRVLNPAK